MSNDLIISTAGLPDYIRELGGYVDEGLAAGVQARAPKLGITIDKAFTITKDGQTVIIQGEDGYPARTVVGVIIAASDTLTKAWYEKPYEQGSFEAPDCFSNDGKVPAAGVAKPQCTNCASCPKNAFGSHPVTGRGKACADRKMIAMIWQGAPDEVMTFNVPTMSLQSLAKLNSDLKAANIAMQSVAVQLSFDMSKTYSVVKIGTVGFINKDAFLKYKNLADTDEVRSLLRDVDYEPVAEAPAQQVVPQNEVNFGGAGGAQEETNAQQGQNQQQAGTASVDTGQAANVAATPAASAEAPAKRTRRTKAQMEADRAAAAAAAQGGQGQVSSADQAANALAQAAAQTQQTQQPDPTVVATQEQQTQQQTTQAADAGGGSPNILNLLSKWQNG